MDNNESSFKVYMLNKGMSRHSAIGYVTSIKNFVNPIIRQYIDVDASDILEVSDVDVIKSYLSVVQSNPKLVDLNNEKHRRISAPLKQYIEFLETENSKPIEGAVGGSASDAVWNEIQVFLKYNRPIPQELQAKYNELLINKTIDILSQQMFVSLKDCKEPVEMHLTFDPNAGVNVTRVQDKGNSVGKNSGMSSKKMPWTNFEVVFPDGHIIKEKRAKDCFARTIREIGVDKVRNLNLLMYNEPLIGSRKSDNKIYASGQIEVKPGLYLMTSGPTDRKIKILEEIKTLLKLDFAIKEL